METRIPVFEEEEFIAREEDIEDSKHDKAVAMDIAGEIGNVLGGANLLESFYCYQDDNCKTDFRLEDPLMNLPPLPSDLDFYREKTIQVNVVFCH